MSIFGDRRVCAAVRTREDFEVALESKVEVIYLLYSNISITILDINVSTFVVEKISITPIMKDGERPFRSAFPVAPENIYLIPTYTISIIDTILPIYEKVCNILATIFV